MVAQSQSNNPLDFSSSVTTFDPLKPDDFDPSKASPVQHIVSAARAIAFSAENLGYEAQDGRLAVKIGTGLQKAGDAVERFGQWDRRMTKAVTDTLSRWAKDPHVAVEEISAAMQNKRLQRGALTLSLGAALAACSSPSPDGKSTTTADPTTQALQAQVATAEAQVAATQAAQVITAEQSATQQALQQRLDAAQAALQQGTATAAPTAQATAAAPATQATESAPATAPTTAQPPTAAPAAPATAEPTPVATAAPAATTVGSNPAAQQAFAIVQTAHENALKGTQNTLSLPEGTVVQGTLGLTGLYPNGFTITGEGSGAVWNGTYHGVPGFEPRTSPVDTDFRVNPANAEEASRWITLKNLTINAVASPGNQYGFSGNGDGLTINVAPDPKTQVYGGSYGALLNADQILQNSTVNVSNGANGVLLGGEGAQALNITVNGATPGPVQSGDGLGRQSGYAVVVRAPNTVIDGLTISGSQAPTGHTDILVIPSWTSAIGHPDNVKIQNVTRADGKPVIVEIAPGVGTVTIGETVINEPGRYTMDGKAVTVSPVGSQETSADAAIATIRDLTAHPEKLINYITSPEGKAAICEAANMQPNDFTGATPDQLAMLEKIKQTCSSLGLQ